VEAPVIPPAPRPADFGEALRNDADVPATHRSSDRVIVANPTRTRAPMPSAPEVVAPSPSSGAPTSRQAHVHDGELTPGYDLDGETLHEVAPVAATAPALNRDSEPPASRGPDSGPTASQRAASAEAITVEELESQIRDLESRLDRMIRDKSSDAPAAPPSVPPPRPSAPSREPTDEAATVFDTARELLSTDYYLRQWGRMGMRNRSEEVDEFGLDPKYEARWRPFFDFLYRHYFRVDVEGTARIPEEGRCLIVSNHSGGPLPYDGAMLRATVKRDHPAGREVRWLAEDFVYYLPFVGAVMNRLGAVRACQENAERLLARGAAVAVFPEGAKGMGKLYKDRYRLQRFGRGGFIRLALRTRTPIVPTAIVGAEEANPIVYRIESFTKALGLPYLPITPTFPALGPLGLLPAPTKWKVRFGEPMSFDEHGPGAADDDILVGRLADRVRGAIQGMLDDTLATRTSIWFG
jgi:1-acyl-sn-glycerol-3-phosphate acyltransferase